MKNYAKAAWDYISTKISGIAAFIEPISKALKVAVAEGDVIKIKAHSLELRELGVKLVATADFLEEAVSDGNFDLYEGSQALLLLNEIIDEGEDVITGVDEDDE